MRSQQPHQTLMSRDHKKRKGEGHCPLAMNVIIISVPGQEIEMLLLISECVY